MNVRPPDLDVVYKHTDCSELGQWGAIIALSTINLKCRSDQYKLKSTMYKLRAMSSCQNLAHQSLLLSILFLMSCSLLLEARYDAGHGVDGTLTPGQSGVNVIIAVLEKIDASKVFEWFSNNHLYKIFFRRLAYVESRDGRVLNNTGGIWRLFHVDFNDTQRYVQYNQDLRQNINNSAILRVDWMSINFVDLLKPMYSGLAVVLRLHKLIHESDTFTMPDADELETLWIMHFHGDAIDRWWVAEQELAEYNEKCSVKSDVVFVIDASHSISNSELTEAKNMVYNFTDKLNSSNGDNRIGIILIKSDAEVYLPLGVGVNNTNKAEFLQKINQIPYVPYEYTNTADGLCKLSRQDWRIDDPTVLQVAIVLSDGQSNYKARSGCEEGTTEHVANYLRQNHSHIIVLAVGIGNEIKNKELSLIASRNHLAIELGAYSEMSMLTATLQYQVCYTLSESMTVGNEVDGTMQRGQIKRWILEGVGGAGVTVRLCVRSGRITFYISHLPSPSEVVNDNSATVNTTKNLAIDCSTLFTSDSPLSRKLANERQRRDDQTQETATGTLYITVFGNNNESIFSLQTVSGNVTIDVNECEQDPYPCHESALCYNTDGSFYCECREGVAGDGFECADVDVTHTQHNQIHLESILPSTILSVVILFVLIAVISALVIIWRKKKYSSTEKFHTPGPVILPIHQSEIQMVRQNLKKVQNTLSTTNPIVHVQ